MKRFWLVLLILSSLLFSSDDSTCKKCHMTIYHEFYDSMHRKSSIDNDNIHQAVWNLHPDKSKNDYTCAKCHAPNAKSPADTQNGISCITCHTITEIKEHDLSNENVYSDTVKTFFSAQKGKEDKIVKFNQKKTLFGLGTTTTGSPYHTIDYTNENYYTGKVCMGCHSHKQNSHGFELCRTQNSMTNNKQNCITCHMPQVQGSATSITESPTHAYHGFPGAHTNPQMLEQYIDLEFNQTKKGFSISIGNRSPHNLFLHPLRVIELRTALIRDMKSRPLKTHTFIRTLGNHAKPAMPWTATEVLKNTMIKGQEKREIQFDEPLKSGDKIEVQIGFYPVNPKTMEKLGLQEEKLGHFIVLKTKYFTIEHKGF